MHGYNSGTHIFPVKIFCNLHFYSSEHKIDATVYSSDDSNLVEPLDRVGLIRSLYEWHQFRYTFIDPIYTVDDQHKNNHK